MGKKSCDDCGEALYVTLPTSAGHVGTLQRIARGALFIEGRLKLSTTDAMYETINTALCIRCAPKKLEQFYQTLYACLPDPKSPEPPKKKPKHVALRFPCRGCGRRFGYEGRRDYHERTECTNQTSRERARTTFRNQQNARPLPNAPSEPGRVVIDLNRMDTATGAALNQLAALADVARFHGETDAALRDRVVARLHSVDAPIGLELIDRPSQERCVVHACPNRADNSIPTRRGYCRDHWGLARSSPSIRFPLDVGRVVGIDLASGPEGTFAIVIDNTGTVVQQVRVEPVPGQPGVVQFELNDPDGPNLSVGFAEDAEGQPVGSPPVRSRTIQINTAAPF